MPRGLAGIRVLDLTRALSGPFATMILGDLGADVIKVEDVWHGDDTRRWGPPFQGDDAAYFLSVNRNKRGLSVNMKEPRGRNLVRRLAGASDVMIENFRPGTAARLGLGYDAVAQAVSVMMSVTGEPDGEPVRSGTSLGDTGAGMWAVIGILAALHAREASGRGQLVDVSLLDGQVAWLTYVAGKYFATGVTPGRHGSAHESLTPYQVLPTADAPRWWSSYRSLRSASRSRMLAWTLTRPDSHIRAMLAGVAESEITSSLFPVSLISAGGSSGAASLTGSAPCSVILVMNVTPRSVTWQLNERLLKWLARACGSISPSRLVRACSASRHSSAEAMCASL